MRKTTKYMTVRQVAEQLGQTYNAVWYAAERGKGGVNPLRVGSSMLFTAKDVAQLRRHFGQRLDTTSMQKAFPTATIRTNVTTYIKDDKLVMVDNEGNIFREMPITPEASEYIARLDSEWNRKQYENMNTSVATPEEMEAWLKSEGL